MSEHENNENPERDAELSRAWGAASTERTPTALDRVVLGQAKDAVRPRRYAGPAGWRPLAFAATLVLGVALLFDMQSSLDSDTAPGVLPESLPSAATLPEEERGAPAAGLRARDKREPAAAAPAEREAAGSAAAERLESREAASQSARPDDDGATDGAKSLRKLHAPDKPVDAPAGTAGALGADRAEPACNAEETATADAWWTCIRRLENAGDTGPAAAELRRLRERFPDFHPER